MRDKIQSCVGTKVISLSEKGSPCHAVGPRALHATRPRWEESAVIHPFLDEETEAQGCGVAQENPKVRFRAGSLAWDF